MAHLDPQAILQALSEDARLRSFLRGTVITAIPARQARRLLMLDVIAQGFEPGRRYPEQQVSEFLAVLHPDHATLRRHLVDTGLLSRANGEYWRSGGTVLTPGPPA